jgi:hypothetical protein
MVLQDAVGRVERALCERGRVRARLHSTLIRKTRRENEGGERERERKRTREREGS